MTDDRYKQIMKDLGMPNSKSLLQALQQVANEVEQEIHAAKADRETQYPTTKPSAILPE